jgi:hypothetical protein
MTAKIKSWQHRGRSGRAIQLQGETPAASANISFVTVVGRTSLAVKVKSNEKPAGYRQKPVSLEGRCAQTEMQNWQSAFTRNRTLGQQAGVSGPLPIDAA